MDTSADAYFPDPRPLPPGQRRQLWARLAIRLGIFLSLVLFLCLAGRPLLSLCMPFALALLATWLTEPLLRFFHRRWNIRGHCPDFAPGGSPGRPNGGSHLERLE